MLRLCSDSSRSYPGRSVRIAVPVTWVCALHGNMPGIGQKSAEAIVGDGRRFQAIKRLETSPAESGKPYPAEGPNDRKGEEPQ